MAHLFKCELLKVADYFSTANIVVERAVFCGILFGVAAPGYDSSLRAVIFPLFTFLLLQIGLLVHCRLVKGYPSLDTGGIHRVLIFCMTASAFASISCISSPVMAALAVLDNPVG